MDAFTTWLLTAYQAASPVVVLGDFSIAPDDRDVYDPDARRGRNLCITLAAGRGRVTESTGQMMDRAAACVAEAEEMWRSQSAARWAEEFAGAMRRLEFLPTLPRR